MFRRLKIEKKLAPLFMNGIMEPLSKISNFLPLVLNGFIPPWLKAVGSSPHLRVFCNCVLCNSFPSIEREKPKALLPKLPEVNKGCIKDIGQESLVEVKTCKDSDLWKELVDRYHCLGLRTTFGGCLPYFI